MALLALAGPENRLKVELRQLDSDVDVGYDAFDVEPQQSSDRVIVNVPVGRLMPASLPLDEDTAALKTFTNFQTSWISKRSSYAGSSSSLQLPMPMASFAMRSEFRRDEALAVHIDSPAADEDKCLAPDGAMIMRSVQVYKGSCTYKGSME